jgi:hypothetical protein
MKIAMRRAAFVAVVFAAGFTIGQVFDGDMDANAQGQKVFELRTYIAPEGKLPNLLARFSDDTLRIFENHGMHNVAYWVPQDAPASQNTLIYVLSHDSREAAQKSWAGFRDDPEWARVSAASQVDGPIVESVTSVFLEATEFSPMK